jgi:hypothetical protein
MFYSWPATSAVTCFRRPFQILLLCYNSNADLEDEDLEEDMGGGGRAAGEPGSASPGGGRRNRYDDFGGDLSDEMDDFIVDGEDGDRRRARRRRDARVAQAAGLSTAAVQVSLVSLGISELVGLQQQPCACCSTGKRRCRHLLLCIPASCRRACCRSPFPGKCSACTG